MNEPTLKLAEKVLNQVGYSLDKALDLLQIKVFTTGLAQALLFGFCLWIFLLILRQLQKEKKPTEQTLEGEVRSVVSLVLRSVVLVVLFFCILNYFESGFRNLLNPRAEALSELLQIFGPKK